ncbi:MAG: ATP-dependent metallopeptidase FtsH/Yme1/Tma family protein [Clostridia bacterium]|nr:ATP-dependent metallopeptidase FtsH/Yme1/Tma family protein [Clostridia bacterium]
MNKKKKILLMVVLVVVVASIMFVYNIYNNQHEYITYNEFISQLGKQKIDKVYLSEGDKIKVLDKDGTLFITDNPRKQDFKEMLLLKGVAVQEKGYEFQIQSILGTVFFIGTIVFLMYYLSKRSGGMASNNILKMSSAEKTVQDNVQIKFEDVAGNYEAKQSIRELIDFIKNPDKYSVYGARLPRGIILYGPPGNGKTLLAKALAGEAGVPFYAVSGSDFVQVYVGVGAARIRNLFKKARQAGKCVIFIDEIDALGKKRGSGTDGAGDEKDQTLNALLTEMSGFNENEGIVVVAATNRLDTLDEALLRPGRFDRHVEIRLPDVNERLEVLKLHSANKPLSDKVDLKEIAKQTVYFSGAQLENMLNEAAIVAAERESHEIDMVDLDKAFYKVVAGDEKKDRSTIDMQDRKITAYHEAGHALVTKIIAPDNTVSKITIIPSTKGAGGFSMNIPPDRMYSTKSEMENNIKISIAGRAAEEIVFGEQNITSGAYNDIEKATDILMNMVKRFGMYRDTGLLNYDIMYKNSLHVNIDGDIVKYCKERMQSFYTQVKALLNKNIHVLDKIAEKLLAKETINEKELNEILSQTKKSA